MSEINIDAIKLTDDLAKGEATKSHSVRNQRLGRERGRKA